MQEKKIIEQLDELHENGTLVRMVSAGLMSPSLIVWREVYHFDKRQQTETGSKMQAAQNSAEEFSISERMVRYIRERMDRF